MATAGLSRVLQHIRQALPASGDSDGQLLGRFVAGRDESAFEALLLRHGSMVLAVCRRVLGDVHDAEDAFQAAFLLLARKAASVARAESLGCWLHQVAHRVALEARAVKARRRAREKPMSAEHEPAVAAAEPVDWRPLLDEELGRLPEKYRAAVILCELECRPRREAARLLGVPEGTLSSRLAAARKMLAARLARRGVVLSGAGLAAALAEGVTAAAVPAALVGSTVRVAALVAAGLEVAATPATVLMKGVLKTMFLTKLKLAMATVPVVGAVGTGGFAYQTGQPAPAKAGAAAKPASELEALRRKNELLELNLQVVLEKVRAQEEKIRALEDRARAERRKEADPARVRRSAALALRFQSRYTEALRVDPVQQMEAALKALREARDKEAKQRAIEAIEKAAKQLRGQVDGAGKAPDR
jgi:RNA polymerase sigma factor (sigma-70 family)